MLRNQYILCVVLLIVIVFSCATTNADQSLYVISHSGSYLRAFEIDGNQLVFQKQIQVDYHGWGAIDLAIDNESNVIFISYENASINGSAILEIVNSKSLQEYEDIDQIVLDGPTNFTGMVYDPTRKVLFGTQRNTNHLYAFHWDAKHFTLTPDPANPIELAGILSGATDVSLNGDIIYVSDYYYGGGFEEVVHAYDLNDNYAHLGDIQMGAAAVAIDYNPLDNVIYCGAYNPESSEYDYLIKCDPNNSDPNAETSKNIGANVIGVESDDDTGLVYVTTYRDYSCAIEVYDAAGWETDPNITADAEFIYDNNNNDGVTLIGLAGLVIGGPCKPSLLGLTKTDNIGEYECAEPNDTITYTICYTADPNDQENVVITDYLPPELTYETYDPNHYDPFTHTYTWDIGHVEGSSGQHYLYLTVRVNEQAQPGSMIYNQIEIENENSYTYAMEATTVCCWGGDIIYVKQDADGYSTGTSWQDAYPSLQQALTRTGSGCGTTIWVARGTYHPGNSTTSTFEIPDHVELYGGFAGTEDPNIDLDDRNLLANKTILSSYVDGMDDNEKVVIMGDESILDSFIVTDAEDYGIFSDTTGIDFSISHCVVKNNGQTGIYLQNCNAVVSWCTIKENDIYGIYHNGSGYALDVNNCMIHNNNRDGIYSGWDIPTILNSMIYNNGSDSSYYYGVRLYYPSNTPVICGSTIVYNNSYAVHYTGSYPPDIDNCIFWANNLSGNGTQLYNCTNIGHSCIQDPSDPNSTDPTPDGNGNVKCNPMFAYPNSNPNSDLSNYHLDPNSPCIGKGNSNLVGLNEYDIDYNDRIVEPNVDIGADEVDCNDVYNPCDWYPDGIVNMREFSDISAAWLSDPYDANWNPLCDLYEDDVIDINDLAVFAANWLWTACWLDTEQMFYSMMAPPSGGESLSAFSSTALTEESYIEPIPLCSVEEMTAWLEDIYNDNEEFQLGYSSKEWQEFIDLVRDTWPSP
jgi:uncharacterized repeat protein (TIGR01451 family)